MTKEQAVVKKQIPRKVRIELVCLGTQWGVHGIQLLQIILPISYQTEAQEIQPVLAAPSLNSIWSVNVQFSCQNSDLLQRVSTLITFSPADC